ncbi:M14 family metallopeptidase [Bacillus suaedae]|uniref:LysM peptidoglycan-binding domain-containing protein n=1 Tax=Halalkalibacter suaedae TaxID=2822140 RepID=A0A941AMH9_9BACI|nr:M14 family metallopeptidase [Bacillus suaedae]MBP3950545.1 LysM peptidoglycan-binding domain-containing protein [Bacillus suaedae]
MRHIVNEGETIAKIAYMYGIRPFDLLLFNRHLDSESAYVKPGTKLHITNSISQSDPFDWDGKAEFSQVDLENILPLMKSMGVGVEIIGYSVMRKPIYALTVGRGEKEIFYSGGWHANEWHTSKFLTLFIHQLALKDQMDEEWEEYRIQKLLDHVKLVVVPLVNPDGVDLVLQGIYKEHPFYDQILQMNKGMTGFDHWSSNIRGVDLNHQWAAGWEIEAEESPQQPWSRHYSGTKPLTEPEAKAIYRLTKEHCFNYVLAFHSQGQVIYWGYRGLEPAESNEMVRRLSLKSSYTPIHTADSDGGYKDWFIKETGKPGFTIEVGVGTNPLSPKAFAEVWSNNCLLALEGLCLWDR